MPFCDHCNQSFKPLSCATGERYWCCIECAEKLARDYNEHIQLYEDLYTELRSRVESLFGKIGFKLQANALVKDSYDDTIDGIPLPALRVADLDLYWFSEAKTGRIKLQLSGTSYHAGSRWNPPEIDEAEIETFECAAINLAVRKLAHVWLDQLIDAHAEELYNKEE